MGGQRSGSAGRICIAVCQRLAKHRFDRAARQRARSQQHREPARAVDDGRFDADVAIAAVEYAYGIEYIGGGMIRTKREK